MTTLKHPGIIEMKSAWMEQGNYYLLFDYALNGDLSGFLREQGELDFSMAQYFSAQLVNTLAFLRSQNIVHRDLKPANVLLNEKWQTKLADFGTALNIKKSTGSINSQTSISDTNSCFSACSANVS